jgi:hypothetical protein
MLGNFLRLTKHRCDKAQFAQLGELVIQNFYHHDKEISHIAENVAHIMVTQAEPKMYSEMRGVFNFLRKRQTNFRGIDDKNMLFGRKTEDIEFERKEVLTRIRNHSFPTIATIISQQTEEYWSDQKRSWLRKRPSRRETITYTTTITTMTSSDQTNILQFVVR